MKARKKIEWPKVEAEYRAGMLSVREIARTYDVTEGAIRKKAKAEGWTADLAPAVREGITEALTPPSTHSPAPSPDAEIVAHAARRGADVIRIHRKDIQAARGIVENLFHVLDDSIRNNADLTGQVIEDTAEDKTKTRRVAYLKNLSLPALAGVARDLSGAMRHLINLERTAFNLDADDTGKQQVVNFGVLTGLNLKPKERPIN